MPPPSSSEKELTVDALPELLKNDTKVKLAGFDIDGIPRGKLISKKKFLSVAKDGFGFCSVIFGWDMHDQTYFKELKISNKENGYRDIVAVPDLSTYRRIPWEDDVPFFLVSFYEPDTRQPVSADPRGLLRAQVDKLRLQSLGAMAGGMTDLRSFLKCISMRIKNTMVANDSAAFLQPSTSFTSSAHLQILMCQCLNVILQGPLHSSETIRSTRYHP